MTRRFSYIPTGHTLPLTALDTHEYFGADYKKGMCSVSIFRTEVGTLRAVWSYGLWSTYVAIGTVVEFEHTQTNRRSFLTLISIHTHASPCDLAGKAAQWTLTTMPQTHETREAWLNAGIAALDEKYFAGNGYDLPKALRASCGFPRASSNAIGQCWDPEVSADETYEIFICPTQAAPVRVLDILLHELIHASVGIKEGHKGMFRKLAKEFGLEGPMRATFAEDGSELHKELQVFAGRLGDYPHGAMTKKRGAGKTPNKWIRFKSEQEDSYRVTIGPSALEEFGPPRDPWGEEMWPVSPITDGLG